MIDSVSVKCCLDHYDRQSRWSSETGGFSTWHHLCGATERAENLDVVLSVLELGLSDK